MKTNERQLFGRLGRGAFGLQVLLLMLVLLLGGVTPAWAGSWDKTNTDNGGGTYRFKGEYNTSSDNYSGFGIFETAKRFDLDKNQFYWDFAMRVDFLYLASALNIRSGIDGEIYLVTSDNVSHKIATWKKEMYAFTVSYSQTDNTWGTVATTNLHGYENFSVFYTPNSQAVQEGVKRIIMKQYAYTNIPFMSGVTYWTQYEKDLDFSGITAEKPMPKPTIEWGDGGKLTFKASGVPDRRNNSYYAAQGYAFDLYYYNNGKKSSQNNTYTTADGNKVTYSNENNGKMDMTFSYWPLTTSEAAANGVYTVPVYVNYYGYLKLHASNMVPENHILSQPKVSGVLIKPFTRPVSLDIQFDKWNKKNIVKWSRQTSVKGYNGSNEVNVECRYDGKWYVVRYEKGSKATDYKVIGTLNGNVTSLQVTDTGIDYDKEYNYRIIFLPTILESKFKDNLAQLPGYNRTHDNTDLWDEKTVSTKMEVPITLTQDKTYGKAVRLVWKYSIPASGLKWTIEYKSTNGGTWLTRSDSPSIDTNKTEASIDVSGTVCDPVTYRIKTTIQGKDLYSDTLSTTLPSGSYISEVKATTGTKESEVTVNWKVENPDLVNDIHYRVLRRPLGAEGPDSWTVIAADEHGTKSEYEVTDKNPLAGTYYEYTVEAFGAKCGEQMVRSDAAVAPGYSQARGTITGHISFGSGTAVQGVRVNLVKSSTDESNNQPQFLSRRIDGDGSGLLWRANADTYTSVLNGQQSITLQLWAKPQSTAAGGAAQQQLLQMAGALELGVKETGGRFHLYAVDRSKGGTTMKEFTNLVFDDTDFTHVAAVYNGGTWTFYVGNETLTSATMTAAATSWNAVSSTTTTLPTLSLGGSSATRTQGSGYKGFVDDVRLWRRALTEQEVTENHTRILGGTENGLILYWPFDEGMSVKRYAFDIARQDGLYQLNHSEVGVNVLPDSNCPQHLKLYGMTDSEGNYIIKGVPFQQGGTNYRIVPELGVHEFSPATRTMFVSPTSLTANNIDFEDVSSFPMEGYVHYVGTNIPVEGVIIKVDGQTQSKDGELVKTDAKGYYEVNVPIGDHFVEAYLDNHKMVGKGRFPLTGREKFTGAVHYDFVDSTLVNFIGRVGGGEHCDTLGVGFGHNERIVGGPSKNNIGVATIALKMNSEKLSFNCKTGTTETYQTFRTWESDTTSINSHSFTGTDADSKYKDKLIYIQTDSVTGEFSALLPPLKYTVQSIKIGSNDQIEFTELPEIDLTSAKELRSDSVLMVNEASADTTWVKYSYVAKMVKTYYAPPQLIVTQKGSKGFGEQEMKDYAVSGTEKMDIENIWTEEADGSIKYTYGFPVFAREKEYKFDLRGYELYTNYDTGKAVNDTIALNGQLVTVTNEMSNKQDVVARVLDPKETGLKDGDIYQPKKTQLLLDRDGKNTVTFTTGLPNVTAPYTRRFITSYERKKRTYSGPLLDGIVFGELTNGDNFVTDGPEHVDMVLRDPPGAKGKVTWKTGTSHTKIVKDMKGTYWDEAIDFELLWGTNLKTVNGIGLAIVTSQKVENTMNVAEHGSFTWTWQNDSTFVSTTAENISSSTGSKYVGAMGDVFIGKSHNLIVGTCRKLGFHREAGGIILGLKQAVAIEDEIATDFVFTAREIEETMIPKLIDTRNNLLQYMDEAAAKSYVNNTEEDVYLTWKKPGDADYGQEGTYEYKPGKNPGSQDMVLFSNEAVARWKARLADNEQDKLDAMNARETYLKENRSFDGGTSYTYSERRDSSWVKTKAQTTKVGFEVKGKLGLHVNAAGSFGTNLTLKTDNGYTASHVTGDSLDNKSKYVELDYELNDGNAGTDFSVDIFRSPRGWGDIFVLRGGQSYNPYEGEELARFYEPEKKHVISYGTEKMEQPVIRISTDGKIGASSATLNDVPAGGTGEFILHLTNGTTTNSKAKFTYELDVAETYNPNGLEVLMDGVPAKGRGIYIPAGETVTKTITVRQTDQSILDYEGIRLWFCSQYQPFSIYDECKLNVHFVPSSSPVELAITEPVVNCSTDSAKLEMKVKGFNRQFKNLKNVGVQYRFAGNTQWTNLYTWWVNPEDTTGLSKESNKALPATGDLKLKVKMLSDLTYPEGNYEFRAFTTTPYGNDDVHVYSDIVTVTKDLTRPRNLYTPDPADGILNYGDQLAIEFNEDIVPGYVGADNVIVTAKLNSQEVNHDVAYEILPYGNMPRTVNPVFLKGNFSIDFWLNWHQAGTILHQGEGTDNFALAVDDEGHVKVTIAKAQFVSTKTVPKDEWVYYALSYNAAAMKFDILAQYGETTVDLFENQPVTDQNVQVVNYATDNHLYLGKIWADMHGLSLYNICLDVHEAAATKYQAKDNYVYGMANYWPMDEGHGTVAADTRHTHDFAVDDSWVLKNKNYSLRIDNKDGARADITRITTGLGDSYAIEMWYHNNGDKDEVVFETATPTVDGDLLAKESKLRVRLDSEKNVVLDYGKKSQIVASHTDFPNLMNWHHYALNVVRGQAASFYLDGQRTAVMAEADVPPIEGSHLVVGKNNTSIAFADELRIWHAALSERRLLGNMYNTLDTTDVYSRGLVAYYPFEKTGEENGVTTKVATLENMAPNLKAGDAKEIAYHANSLFENTPPLKNAPEETRLIASPVASERKVVVNLTGAGISLRDIEGTTLNITVDQIHDLHGNTSEPIKWTAYVQQNTLKWMKDSVNVIKQYGDPYTFDVNIENRSGNEEYYTLYNMPQWLSLVDSERSDEVTPLSTKTLRFEVNPLVPVGNYDLNIGLQGNNGILEPLRIVMKVSGEKPDWTVDPTKYDHNMTIVGQVYLNGILMENPESMVAAFIGGECRGVAQPKQIRGAAYVTMNIYGTDDDQHDRDKAVSFRIWDASRGVAYTNANITVPVKTATGANSTLTSVIFAQDQMLGNYNTPAVWTKSDNVEQLIPIHQNWNWIAFGVEPESPYLNHVFSELSEWQLLIKSRNAMNDYNGAEWGDGTLTTPKVNEMYKLKVTSLPNAQISTLNAQLSVSGRQPIAASSTSDAAKLAVTLQKGWNWIAYTPLTTMTIDEALAAASPQPGDIVKSQTAVAIYDINGWDGTLTALEGGHGYMYYSVDGTDKSFLYPTTTVAQAHAMSLRAPRRAPDALRIFTPVSPTFYPNNMTMVVQLRDGETVVDTCEVAAFVGDECRGAVRANTKGLYYLVIAGEGAGQPMTLRTCLNGMIIDIDSTQQFVSDGNIGTTWEPYVIDLSDVLSAISTITIDDTDDADWWTLQGFKIGRKPTQPGVYIHHGQKVTIKRMK